MDSYESALEAAGAKILAFESFGSYQGDWWAKVEIGNRIGWVHGYFGSCSGCDAFEAEFGYYDERCDEHKYSNDSESIGCKKCEEEEAKYQERLSYFGAEYLDEILTQEEAEAECSKNIEWDIEANEALEFIKLN